MELLDFGGSPHLSIVDSSFQVFLIDTAITVSSGGVKEKKFTTLYTSSKMSRNGNIYVNIKNVMSVFKNHEKVGSYIFPSEILKMYIDGDDDLWVGTDRDGVYLFKNADVTKTPVHALPSLSISSILLDKEGSVWASTLEKGVFQCMNKRVLRFTEKTRDFKIIDNKLNVAFETQKLLIASSIDSMRLENVPVTFDTKAKFCTYSTIKGAQYFGLGSHTFYTKDKKTAEIHQKTGDFMYSRYFIRLPNDTLLAVGNHSIFFIYDTRFIRTDTTSFIINNASQLPDKRTILTSRSNAGLFEYKNGKFIPFLPHVKELNTRINAIAVDSSGNFWFATNEKGIFCYDTHQRIHTFNKSNGLLSNKVNDLIIIPNGNIWCGTYDGLSRLIPSSNFEKVVIENFDKNHGIVDLEIERLIYFDHTIWCGAKTALFYFHPENMYKNRQPPIAYIKSINVKGENYLPTDSLFLNHDQNDFHIQYGLISFKKTPSRAFFYRLNGYDNTWKLSNTGDIQYTNISYGTYTLFVYAINNDGIKSQLPHQLTFIIKRPFWFTWWFVTLMVILFLFLIYLGAQYWRKRIEKKERDKAAINQQLSEFKMTALRS
ncbi:MAG TPA: two-component regulator propeller domain-containing protein, partial [Bacteroidia bacterium]|nr:two-component regulator propeller domain-containing protein [Bacteroidia bacterium]